MTYCLVLQKRREDKGCRHSFQLEVQGGTDGVSGATAMLCSLSLTDNDSNTSFYTRFSDGHMVTIHSVSQLRLNDNGSS